MQRRKCKMTDIDIIPVQRLDFLVSPLPWSFAADRRTEIEDYFTHLRRTKPQLWNGRVLVLRDFEISDTMLRGTLFETDYASFIAWRDWGFPDRDVRACFAMGALLSCDGAFVLGVMNAHTAGAGGIYFSAGMPDPRDVVCGRVDFDRNVRREIAEETGLSVDGTTADPWLVVLVEQSVALIKVFRFSKSATEMRASILDHLRNEALPELSDVHIVRAFRFQTEDASIRQSVPSAFLGSRWRAMRSVFARTTRARGLSSDLRNGGLGGSAWSRLSLRCTI